jgi:nucleotide-binding universal stress UspA family protein
MADVLSQSAAAAPFRRILVPVDFHMPSHRAVCVAIELRRRFGASVCVFHAVRGDENDQFLAGLGSPASREDLLDEASAELRRFLQTVVPEDADAIECDARMEDDYVGAIRAKASEWEATLLVLSPESHPSLLRTHSEKLMKSLTVPVLLLEPPPASKS